MKKMIAKEARKQIMYAVDFRSMHTAIHGLYYGKNRRDVEQFAKALEAISSDDLNDDERYFAMEDLYAQFPDIKMIEEVNYRDLVELPGGYKGMEDDDTIYRFVNNVALDLYMESFKKIVKESSSAAKFRRSIEAAKNRIIRKVERNGIVENLGQDEVRRLRDILDDMVSSGDCEKSDELQMSRMLDDFDDWASTYTGKIVKEDDEGGSDHPRIYVGTYAKYNDGNLAGKWIDLSKYEYEEFVDACRKLHKDEKDPEFMVQDYENYPEKWYHEAGLPTKEEFEKINEFYMMDDDRKAAYEAYVNYTNDDDIEHFEDAYQGKFNSAEDFAYDLVDGIGWDGVGKNNLEMYFDYDSFGRDLMYDFHRGDEEETDTEGNPEDPDHYYDQDGYDMGEYESDEQVAYDYIDNIGGIDQLGKETLQNYFDYDSFGRDLLINDYFEEDGYVFLRM